MSTTIRTSELSYLYNYDSFSDENDEEGQEEEEQSMEFIVPDDVYDTDNESVVEEGPTYLQQLPLNEAIDFFDELGNVPSLGDLASDGTPEMEQSLSEMSEGFEVEASTDAVHIDKSATSADVSLLQSKMSLSLQVPPSVSYVEISRGEASDTSEEGSEDYDDLVLPDEAFDEGKSKTQDADDALEMFLGLETLEQFAAMKDAEFQMIAKSEEAELIRQNTLAFVIQLINQVVEIVESKTPQEILRQNLDKRKLLEHIWKDHKDLQVERSMTLFLNRKIVEFYKRKKTLRPIIPDKLKNLTLEIAKHKCVIEHLDKLLGEEAYKSQIKAQTTNELKQKLRNFFAKVQAEVDLFENMVKDLLMKESRPKLNALLEKILATMANYRKQISNTRFELLMKQDTKATLTESLNQMENLGNGLTLKSFSTLQTETQALDKKLEERNNDLNKLHIRMRDDIHQNSHFKEKQRMLRNTLAVQRMALEELYEEKNELRAKIHVLKIKRLQVRSEIKELSFKGGLVDKPALLYDYDRTCEKIARRKQINNYLRGKQQDLQKQIDALIELIGSSSMRSSL